MCPSLSDSCSVNREPYVCPSFRYSPHEIVLLVKTATVTEEVKIIVTIGISQTCYKSILLKTTLVILT